MKTATMTIDGMSCGGCVTGVRRALEGVQGLEITELTVGRAVLRVDPARLDEAALRRLVGAAGFEVRSVEVN